MHWSGIYIVTHISGKARFNGSTIAHTDKLSTLALCDVAWTAEVQLDQRAHKIDVLSKFWSEAINLLFFFRLLWRVERVTLNQLQQQWRGGSLVRWRTSSSWLKLQSTAVVAITFVYIKSYSQRRFYIDHWWSGLVTLLFPPNDFIACGTCSLKLSVKCSPRSTALIYGPIKKEGRFCIWRRAPNRVVIPPECLKWCSRGRKLFLKRLGLHDLQL